MRKLSPLRSPPNHVSFLIDFPPSLGRTVSLSTSGLASPEAEPLPAVRSMQRSGILQGRALREVQSSPRPEESLDSRLSGEPGRFWPWPRGSPELLQALHLLSARTYVLAPGIPFRIIKHHESNAGRAQRRLCQHPGKWFAPVGLKAICDCGHYSAVEMALRHVPRSPLRDESFPVQPRRREDEALVELPDNWERPNQNKTSKA